LFYFVFLSSIKKTEEHEIKMFKVLISSILFSHSKGRTYPKCRMFENRVLRRICGPKREGVTEGWRMDMMGGICSMHRRN
jgi:hypothetical protein